MPSRKKSMAVPLDPAEVANIAMANPYIQRLINDAELRDNLRTAIDSGRSAFDRLSNGKAPYKTLLEDKKVQRDLRQTFESARSAVVGLQEAPRRPRPRRGASIWLKLLLVIAAAVGALAASEKLRSKVLDALFGAEEEFQYTPPAANETGSPPSTPVSAA